MLTILIKAYCVNIVTNIKVGLSPSKKICFICFNKSPLKMMADASFFHLKISFRPQNIKSFFLTFWSCRKNSSIRKIRLISDVTTWLTNNYNMHIAQYVAK